MPRLRCSLTAASALFVAAFVFSAAPCALVRATDPAEPTAVTLKLVFREAIEGGLDDENRTWLTEHVRRANLLFHDSGIRFSASYQSFGSPEPKHLVTRKDRHALGAHLTSRPVIHVFVVQSLKDVDIENKWISGVHWRPRGLPGKHFVILSRKAQPWTLAHELGHFFGNPHSDTVNNIMSYEHDGKREPFFDAAQRTRITEHLERFISSGELGAQHQRRDRHR